MDKKGIQEVLDRAWNKAVNYDNLPQSLKESLEEFRVFRHELTVESDRGCALLASSYLESLTEKIFEKILIGSSKHKSGLLNFNGPLGTFSGRISMLYSLGIISKEDMSKLDNIRKIRNVFGHSPLILKFEDDKLKSWCMNLPPVMDGMEDTCRQRFRSAVSSLAGQLQGIYVSQPKFDYSGGKEESDESLAVIKANFKNFFTQIEHLLNAKHEN